MSKPVKVIAIIGSVVIVLLLALVVVVKVVVTPEKVRATVLPLAEEQLDRKVDFKGFGVSLFSGITLEGFTVFEADGVQSFVSLEGLVLEPRILPLFAGRVVVDEVRLVQPRILVVRNEDGSFNFSTLGKPKEGEVETTTATDEPSSGGGIDLLVASVNVSDGEVVYRDHALQPGKPFELKVTDLGITASDISLDRSFPVNVKALVAGAPLEVAAEVNAAEASGGGKITLKGLALKTFKVIVGDGYPEHLEPLTVDLDLDASGSAEQVGVKGNVGINLAGERVTLRLDAPEVMTSPLPVSVAVESGSLQLDKLLPPEGAEGKGGKSTATAEKGKAEEPGPFDIPVKAGGQVAIQKLAYNTLTMEQVNLDWSLVDNVFTLKDFTSKVAGGGLGGNARVDLGVKGLNYKAAFAVDKIQADPLVTAFYPEYQSVVSGGLDLALKLRGKGTTDDALKRNLTGDGNLLIEKGKVVGAPLVDGLAAFLGSEELKVLSFSETKGSFRIKDGKILFDTNVDGSQARMQPKGYVGLDGGLDVRLETRLNPELTRKVAGKNDFAGALTDEQGWGLFPIRVKGSVNKPKFRLDSKAVRKQAQQKVQEKAVEKLSEELFKDSESKDAGEQMLKDTLKGLFGN